jgi:hypothetical protein
LGCDGAAATVKAASGNITNKRRINGGIMRATRLGLLGSFARQIIV